MKLRANFYKNKPSHTFFIQLEINFRLRIFMKFNYSSFNNRNIKYNNWTKFDNIIIITIEKF